MVIHFDIASIKNEIERLEEQVNAPDFWSNIEISTPIITKLKRLQNKVTNFNNLLSELVNLKELNEMLIVEEDDELVKQLLDATKSLKENIERLDLETLFIGKYDKNNAIITLHPGAGGTESQDWVQMLYRMYTRWAISNGFDIKELDFLEGDEAGIKSVTALVSGENAYGYLKCEMGVHRLVRISPFDSGGRRHTSFASLEVLPEITEDIQIEINPDDIRIDTYRASRSRRTAYK